MKYHFIFEIDHFFPPGCTFKYKILFFYSDKEERHLTERCHESSRKDHHMSQR